MEKTSSSSSSSLPLPQKWKLWAHLPKESSWSMESYVEVADLHTAEDVVGVFQSLPAELIQNCMLFLMKDGINPMWEDPQNCKGGSFSYKISNKFVADVFKLLAYHVCGTTLVGTQEFNKDITGITISPKKQFCVIKVWMRSCRFQNPAVIANIANMPQQGCLFKKHVS